MFDSQLTSHNNSGQVVNTCLSQSASSIVSYQPKTGNALQLRR